MGLEQLIFDSNHRAVLGASVGFIVGFGQELSYVSLCLPFSPGFVGLVPSGTEGAVRKQIGANKKTAKVALGVIPLAQIGCAFAEQNPVGGSYPLEASVDVSTMALGYFCGRSAAKSMELRLSYTWHGVKDLTENALSAPFTIIDSYHRWKWQQEFEHRSELERRQSLNQKFGENLSPAHVPSVNLSFISYARATIGEKIADVACTISGVVDDARDKLAYAVYDVLKSRHR